MNVNIISMKYLKNLRILIDYYNEQYEIAE